MIIIQETLVSEELFSRAFACDLHACKGACCVEGDEGAFLEENDLPRLRRIFPKIKHFLTKAGIQSIEKQGYAVRNAEGILKTPLIGGGPCAYICYENGIALCGIEKAQRAGVIRWKKPLSCHLYPVRITKVGPYDALNYERWHICNPACKNGKSLHMPVFRFVKDALIRKYGKSYYEAMEATHAHLEKQKDEKQKS